MNTGRTGWLDPDGKFFPCSSYDHMVEAERLVKKYGYEPDEDGRPDDDLLLLNGWVRISILTVLRHSFYISYFVDHLKQEQLRFLKPYLYEEYGLPVEDYCKRDLLRQIEEN